MDTIKYYLIALAFISSACLLAYAGRKIVQKMCYTERGNEYRNLDFKTWVAEVWKFENKLLKR